MAPVSESEQSRRKATIDRAKAIQLSKSLQLRLQYAKLKVEHGWQRNSLNEVENLYWKLGKSVNRHKLPTGVMAMVNNARTGSSTPTKAETTVRTSTPTAEQSDLVLPLMAPFAEKGLKTVSFEDEHAALFSFPPSSDTSSSLALLGSTTSLFGSQSPTSSHALTYDSFWSSHTRPIPKSIPLMPSTSVGD